MLMLSTLPVVQAEGGPDLAVGDLRVESEPIERRHVLSANVTNAGDQADGTFTVALFVDGRLVEAKSFPPGMPAGFTLKVTGDTWDLAAGTHELRVVADWNGELAESDESNNDRSLLFTVAPVGVDLFVESAPKAYIFEGQPLPIAWRYGNRGAVGATAPFTTTVAVDGAEIHRMTIMTGMPANSSATANVQAPPQAAGLHEVRVVIDVDDNVTDVDAGNDVVTFFIDVLRRPDLVVRDFSFDPVLVQTPQGPVAHPLGRHAWSFEVCNEGGPMPMLPEPTLFASISVHGTATRAGVATVVNESLPEAACWSATGVTDLVGAAGDFEASLAVDMVFPDADLSDNFAWANGSRLVSGVRGVVVPNGAQPPANDGALLAALADLANVAETPSVVAVVGAAEALCGASALTLPCAQFRGQYGIGALSPCGPPPTGNPPAALLWSAFHPDDARTGIAIADAAAGPTLRSLPDTGVTLCAPTPRDLAIAAATVADDTVRSI